MLWVRVPPVAPQPFAEGCLFLEFVKIGQIGKTVDDGTDHNTLGSSQVGKAMDFDSIIPQVRVLSTQPYGELPKRT